jgi:hypothetical protein
MPDFNVRADSVNVEQIMEQIRARIREKRGVDYTEQQIRELATVKLERFLDPRGLRSGLLEEFRRLPASQPLPNYAFEDQTLFESHRAPIRWIRRLLQPILKLFFNPNPLIQALHIQAKLNTYYATERAQAEASRHALYYELIHNLVVEMTRLGIEVNNLKMRVESLAGRLEFNERRTRALESVVVYQPNAEEREEAPEPPPSPAAGGSSPPATKEGEGPGQRSRRRRRRRGRRTGTPATTLMGSPSATVSAQSSMSRAGADAPAREPADPHAGSIEHALGVHPHPAEPHAGTPPIDRDQKNPAPDAGPPKETGHGGNDEQ